MKTTCLLQIGESSKPHKWLNFGQPTEILTTQQSHEVLPLLDLVSYRTQIEGLTAVGFVSYGAASAFDPALVARRSSGFPLIWFAFFDQKNIAVTTPNFRVPSSPGLDWRANIARTDYIAKITDIREHIAAGDTYQVNYSYQLEADYERDPRELFSCMNCGDNGRFGAYIDAGRYAICSASPELFFRYDALERKLISRPMKGTIHRGQNEREDAENAAWLQSSTKNRAENLMIVDMIRNDMSRVADPTSVQVSKPFELEDYSTLWTMTSTVESKLNLRSNLTEIFKAMFPCASVTGAPKVNTMQIIQDAEPAPRDIYCGAIGMIQPNGDARFNVAIRTALVDQELDRAFYWVGGGIVWDSEAETEWQETQTKTKILRQPCK